MINYYRINVSLNGKYLFATENGDNGSGITDYKQAQFIYNLLCEAFPKSSGYNISVTYWRSSGAHITFDSKDD